MLWEEQSENRFWKKNCRLLGNIEFYSVIFSKFNARKILGGVYCYSSYFIGEESKGQRCKVTCPKSYCRLAEELEFEAKFWLLINYRISFPGGSDVKNLPAMQETWVRSLVWENPLEKGMATHSSILAWRIPRTEKSGRLQSLRSRRVRHDWAANTSSARLWRMKT